MLDNNIEDLKAEDLENERVAVAMLLAAAQGLQETPAPAPEAPVGNIDDLHDLFERQKQLADELAALKNREADLVRQLQSVRDEAVEIERRSASVKAQAAQLFETLFGRPAREPERATPRSAPPSQIVKPAAVASNASPENPSSFTRIPSLSL
jgi:chromosome segregation ATPase